jgi:hypothetical protein
MTKTAIDNVLSIIESGAGLLASVLHEVASGYDSAEERASKVAEIRERAQRALRSIDYSLTELDAKEQEELDAAVPRHG